MVTVNAKTLLFIVFLFAAVAVLVVVFVLPTSHVAPVENQENEPLTNLWLHTEDNRIVDENGNTVILRGVAIEDPWRFYNYEKELRPEVFRTIAEVWHANVVRVPIYPTYLLTKEDLLRDYYDITVRVCHEYGMYVILDWHGIGNPITGETTTEGLQWGSQTNMENTVNAWHEIAERYKDNSWVIYDIFSKPTDDSGNLTTLAWDNWKSAAENIIDVIRSHNPKALILVSGIASAFDLRSVATNPIDRENIIYAAHIYPVVEVGTVRNENAEQVQQMLEDYIGSVAESYPVMITEWGYYYWPDNPLWSPWDWFEAYPHTFSDPLMEWLNAKKLSWTGWIWSASWPPSMIEGWWNENYPPTHFGQLVKDALAIDFSESEVENIVLQFLHTTDVDYHLYGAIEITENYYERGNLVFIVNYNTSNAMHPQFMATALETHSAQITINAFGDVVSAFCVEGTFHPQGKVWDLINQRWIDA